MAKVQDFKPSRPVMRVPTIRKFRVEFTSPVKIVTEFEDKAASKIFNSPIEISPESPDSELPFLPEWTPQNFDEKPDGVYQVEVVDVFGSSYFVRPCYNAVLNYLQKVKTPSGYLIITGLPG